MELRLHLPGIRKAEIVAALAVETLGEHLRMTPDAIEAVRLAVVEACLNALEHGGGDMEVRLSVQDDLRLLAEVEDHGAGFDPENCREKSATRTEGCVEKRGWGLRLISEMMDEVEINSRPGRTIIRMWKKLPGKTHEEKAQ